MKAAKPVDPMGAALSEAEAVQRAALESAEEAVRVALDALQPFAQHEGRVLAGIEVAVRDVRKNLTESAGNLAAIVTLHLAGRDAKPATPTIIESVDNEHTAKVLAIREAS